MPTTNGTPESRKLSRLEADCARLSGSLRCERLPLARLELPPALFAADAPFVPPPAASFFHPIMAAKTQDGRFVILDGCKRRARLLAEGRDDCPCNVVNTPVSEDQAGLLRILLNRDRSLDIAEKILFFKWLAERGFERDIPRLLHLQDGEQRELRSIVSCCDDVIRAVRDGLIHAQNARDFNLLDDKGRWAFLRFFEGLKLSQQTEREFLDWLPEIASMRGIAVGDILEFPECSAVRKNAAQNDPQKIRKIRAVLYSLRYPRFDAALKRWNALARKVNPVPSSIRFVPDAFFEKDTLEIRVTVSKPEAAGKTFGLLRDISADAWRRLIRPTGNDAQ